MSLTATLIAQMNNPNEWVALDIQNPMSMHYAIDINYSDIT